MSDTKKLQDKLGEIQNNIISFEHALSVLSYDAATVAPEKSYRGRGETCAVLVDHLYPYLAGDETRDVLYALRDASNELDATTNRTVEVMLREYERTSSVPKDEYIDFTVLCNEAEAVWHKAKPENDFASFAPYLEKLIAGQKRFSLYYAPDADPYDTMLDEHEEGITSKQLDIFFATLKQELVPLIHEISSRPQVDDSFLHGDFPVWKQRKLSDYLMSVLSVPRDRCAIGETEHPFTDGNNYDDMRITTHYHADDLASSMYSVIHESGHAIYELCAAKELWRSVLCTGTSMGIHESQSRFFENIIGRSRGFVSLILPKLHELFPSLSGVDAEHMYRGINKVSPSLIRTEADELTYSMHVMIRYELERMLIHGELSVSDLPAKWNALYAEYLGVEVPDDTHGVLQDSHWASAMFGYFPSYALGSAYGAQMLDSMKKDIRVDELVSRGDIQTITEWLTEKIYKYQKLLTPSQVILNSCGAEFNPTYYTDYLKNKFKDIYGI